MNQSVASAVSSSVLQVGTALPLSAHLAGIVISRGRGHHIERIASHFTLLFVSQGVLYIEEEGVEFQIEAGQTFLLWPGRLHRGSREYDENLQFFWLHFNMSPHPHDQPAVPIPQQAQPTRPDVIIELFRRYLDDQGSGTLQPLSAALYAWMILLEVAAPPASQDGATTAALAGRIHTYICSHFHERISAYDIAAAVGYNMHYLCRIYRQHYRMSLTAALRRERIGHAKWLLINTNHRIGHIGQLSGFDDVGYFQRVFKQLEGITPSQFRRLHARMNVVY